MRWTTITVGAALLAGAGQALANSEQESARDAYQRGEIMSLEDIRRNVQRDFNGQIIGTSEPYASKANATRARDAIVALLPEVELL